MAGHTTPTGHVRVEERAKGRVWIAEYQLADGTPHMQDARPRVGAPVGQDDRARRDPLEGRPREQAGRELPELRPRPS